MQFTHLLSLLALAVGVFGDNFIVTLDTKYTTAFKQMCRTNGVTLKPDTPSTIGDLTFIVIDTNEAGAAMVKKFPGVKDVELDGNVGFGDCAVAC